MLELERLGRQAELQIRRAVELGVGYDAETVAREVAAAGLLREYEDQLLAAA